MRRHAFCVLCGLAAACSSPPPPTPNKRGFRMPPQSFRLENLTVGVELFAPAGNVRVEPGDARRLTKTITISAGSEAEARECAERCNVRFERGVGGLTVVRFDAPPETPLDDVGADTLLEIPNGLDLHVRTKSGLLDTSEFVAGNAELESQRGTIRAGRTDGTLIFQNQDGRTELTGSFEVADGRSRSGDLRVRALRPGARLEFRSETGSCTLLVPAELGLDIRFRSVAGEVESSLGDLERLEPTGSGSRWREHRMQRPGTGPLCKVFVQTARGNLVLRAATDR